MPTDEPKEKNPHAVALGALGGKAKSAKKLATVRENVAKARTKRWPPEALKRNKANHT
jgi:hypothetical protein